MRYCCCHLYRRPAHNRGKTDFEGAGRFEDRARQKEANEHQEAHRQKPSDARPDDAPAHLINRRVGRGLDTTAAGFAAGLAGVFGAGVAGGSATATDVCSFGLLSTAENLCPL